MSLNVLLSFAVFLVGSILVLILFFKHKQLPPRLFSFSLFTLSYNVLVIFLFESRYLTMVPFLLRTPAILSYLATPALFLYVSFVLNERNRFRWYDLLHALPAIIYLIDFGSLFLSSNETKRYMLQQLYENPQNALFYREGWLLPSNIHYMARHIISLGYTFVLAVMLVRYWKINARAIKKNRYIFDWLVIVTAMYSLFSMLSILESMLFPASYGWLLMVFNTLGVFSLISMILFFKPMILYGMPNRFKIIKATHEIPVPANLPSEVAAHLQGSFHDYIGRQQFLDKHITLKKVASELRTQPHILSAFINQRYRMHFNELINYYRIQYIKDGLVNKQWEAFTLEAIAEKAGFTNRTTFLSAFKKFTGMTPSGFIIDHSKERKEDGQASTDPKAPHKKYI